MIPLKTYFFLISNSIIVIILILKWFKYNKSNPNKTRFVKCLYYPNYEIINSRNKNSKTNKITQNKLSTIVLIIFGIQIISILLFNFLD